MARNQAVRITIPNSSRARGPSQAPAIAAADATGSQTIVFEGSAHKTVAVLGVVGFFVTLTALGMRAPWYPERTEPLTAEVMGTTDRHVIHGALVFNERGCQLCHSVRASGGAYGVPTSALSTARLPPSSGPSALPLAIADRPPIACVVQRTRQRS